MRQEHLSTETTEYRHNNKQYSRMTDVHIHAHVVHIVVI